MNLKVASNELRQVCLFPTTQTMLLEWYRNWFSPKSCLLKNINNCNGNNDNNNSNNNNNNNNNSYNDSNKLIIMKDNHNNNDDENNTQNKDNTKYLKIRVYVNDDS